MFDQLVESAANRKKDKRGKFFLATSAMWLLSFSLIIVAGIFAYDAQLNGELASIVRIAPQPPPRRGDNQPVRQSIVKQPTTGFVAAQHTPTEINPPNPNPPSPLAFDSPGTGDPNLPGGPGNGDGPGSPDGVEGGLPPNTTSVEPPPRPRETPKPVVEETPKPAPKQEVVRSQILQGSAIRRIQPSYPPIARAAGIQGAVVIEVLIDEAGNVASVRALSGHPILREAALVAARGWKWNPTLLNQKPVKVIGTITFNFTR